MKYLKRYETDAEYQADTKLIPQVSWVDETEKVEYEIPHTPFQDYFATVALSAGDIKFSGHTAANTLSYSLDSGTTWSAPQRVQTVTVEAGDKVLWKGFAQTLTYGKGIGNFSGTTASYNIEGNIMSLHYGDDFTIYKSLPDYALEGLFRGSSKLVSAQNLLIGAKSVGVLCCEGMFWGCANMTTAPSVLNPTTVGQEAYKNMFLNCTSFTTAPKLPATTLANGCYATMFQGCTSLTTAPSILPATTLEDSCYSGMFTDCSNLTTAPELPSTTLAPYCYGNMFNRCTSLTTAPVLSATSLVRQCYQQMFSGCTSLNSITCLATNISALSSTSSWVSGVAATGTFTKAASMSSWTTGVNGIPTGWSVVDYE